MDHPDSSDLMHLEDEENYRLADQVLKEYQHKLTTTGVSQNDILEMGQLEQVIRPNLPHRYQAIINWWEFLEKLVNIADTRSRGRHIDNELTVHCAIDAKKSTESIIKSQRFRLLARAYVHHVHACATSDDDESDDEDTQEWWCYQLTQLFERHKYNI